MRLDRCQSRCKPRYSPSMNPIRAAIENLEPNGIGLVAMTGLGEPDIIPLWFGESDLVTPAFIRDAAKRALDEGKTFYGPSRGTWTRAKLFTAPRAGYCRCAKLFATFTGGPPDPTWQSNASLCRAPPHLPSSPRCKSWPNLETMSSLFHLFGRAFSKRPK